MAEQGEQQQSSPSLDECLKLLKGERDEQRLAGLLLVTKFCKIEDHESLRRVYDAVGVRFLDRLLRTGLAEGKSNEGNIGNQDMYLQLSVTVLAAFCHVPEIAASEDMVSKIPTVIHIMLKQSASAVLEQCYELLFLVSTGSKDGVVTLFDSGVLKVLASQMSSLPNESRILELSVRLIQLIIGQIPLNTIVNSYLPELSSVVVTIGRQFAILQNALKFDLLGLLSLTLSSHHSGPLHNALRSMSSDQWPIYVRAGVADILQNRVAPEQKLRALMVSESMVSISGEDWLIAQMKVADLPHKIPADRCLMLVLESARVEVAVLLNDLAYLKYEAASPNLDQLSVKQRNLAIVFSLVEKIIKLISKHNDDEGGVISESTFTKIISGLNESIGIVFEYLKDSRDHGHKKANDLLASVRVIGSYLAEVPVAFEDKVQELLAYMIAVEGEDESVPFLSVCFLLPMLCQTTMELEGAKVLASSGAYKAVVECLVNLISQNPHVVEDNGCLYLACDTIMNLLLKRDKIHFQLEETVFVYLLKALASWADATEDSSVIMMAATICALIFDSTSEEALLRCPDLGESTMNSLSRLIARSFASYVGEKCENTMSDLDLHQIIAAGYSRWADRYPCVRKALGQ